MLPPRADRVMPDHYKYGIYIYKNLGMHTLMLTTTSTGKNVAPMGRPSDACEASRSMLRCSMLSTSTVDAAQIPPRNFISRSTSDTAVSLQPSLVFMQNYDENINCSLLSHNLFVKHFQYTAVSHKPSTKRLLFKQNYN